MISVEQWRAAIGLWACGARNAGSSSAKTKLTSECLVSIILCASVISVMLVVGGVEMNPGPPAPVTVADVLEEMRAGRREILERLDGHSAVLLELKSFQQRVESLESTVATLEAENNFLSRKIDYLENQSRRNNLLVFGLDDLPGESWSDSESLVRDIGDRIGVHLEEHDIERAHRVGSRRGRRPIVVKFATFKKREAFLMSAARQLRDTRVKVAEDFSVTVRNTRKALGPYLQDARAKGHRASLRFDKLLVDGKPFTLEKLRARNEVRTAPHTPTQAESSARPALAPSSPPPPSPPTPLSTQAQPARRPPSPAAGGPATGATQMEERQRQVPRAAWSQGVMTPPGMRRTRSLSPPPAPARQPGGRVTRATALRNAVDAACGKAVPGSSKGRGKSAQQC